MGVKVIEHIILKRNIIKETAEKKEDGSFVLQQHTQYRIREERLETDVVEQALTRSQFIGHHLKKNRESKGKTWEECGEAIGKSPTTIQNYEQGETSPRLDDLIALCEFIKLDLKKLL